MQAETVQIDSLRLDPRNARLHPARNLEAIKASLLKFGQQKPIVVAHDGIIVAGNGLWLAAKELGWTEIAVVRTSLDAISRTAYSVADNRTTDLGAFDGAILTQTLAELKAQDFDVSMFDFDVDELAAMQGGMVVEGNTDPDAIPAPPDEAISKTGDLWLMGEHRLLCGDVLVDAGKLQLPATVDLTLTDPPYNVGREYTDATDDVRHDYEQWSRDWFGLCRAVSTRVAFSCGHPNVAMWAGIEKWHWMLCWYKANVMLGSPFGFCNWEPVLFYGKVHRPKGGDVLVVPIVVQKDLEAHDCPKQLGFGVKLVELLSDEGHSVLDPFSGSGTTIIACEQLGRKCYAIEIEPRYVDVAVRRWQNFTNKQATLDGDGRTFAEIEAERIGQAQTA